MINWLLVLFRIAIGLEHLAPKHHLLIFARAGIGIEFFDIGSSD